jgi:ElaB/YqjD/DUF883 family membrane-anchored ribosome-binding protein
MADNKDAALPEGTDKVIQGASGDTATIDAPAVRQSSGDGRIADKIRRSTENLSSQAGEKARGLVSQGLERSAEALGNVAKLVGDTAPGIEDRLGAEYGDYARRAASAIEDAANAIADKDPDELIEDTRKFVRNSPGIALAGAAVVGFVVARLLKTGLARDDDDDED